MDFRSVQGHFATCIRGGNPESPPPGVQGEQMAVYADLFRRNIDGLLGGMLPVFRQAMGEARWQDMVRDFLRRHRSSEPLFRRLVEEFLDYLANERGQSDDPG
ncbi:MAG: putative DNA-binding domain-containing protein, partial [Gammaproteobacteria bacterium]|nr:putative DNA-binding domain-containing protein [Gammaproteobacteria bacterium]